MIFVIVGFASLLFVLLWIADTLRPDSNLIRAAREWQTLLGALVGFVALAAALSYESNENRKLAADRSLQSELNMLSSLTYDVRQFIAFHDMQLSTIEHFTDPEQSLRSCMNISKLLRETPLPNSVHQGRLSHISERVSAGTFRYFLRFETLRSTLRRSLTYDSTTACASDPESTIQSLNEFHSEVSSSLKSFEMELNEYFLSI